MFAYFQHIGKYLTMSLVLHMIINIIFKAVFFAMAYKGICKKNEKSGSREL